MNSNNILERWDRLFNIRGCRMLNDTRKSNNFAKKGENACEAMGIVMLDLIFRCTHILGQLRQWWTKQKQSRLCVLMQFHPGEMFWTCLGTCPLMPVFRIYPVGNEIVKCENVKQWLPEETEYQNRAQGLKKVSCKTGGKAKVTKMTCGIWRCSCRSDWVGKWEILCGLSKFEVLWE